MVLCILRRRSSVRPDPLPEGHAGTPPVSDTMTPEQDGSPEKCGSPDDDLATFCRGKMTLESIVDSTGEFEHLNELVMLHVRRCGGFTDEGAYLKTVTPLLDLLEVEIRVKYSPGMTRTRMKKVIGEWIDQEIAELR